MFNNHFSNYASHQQYGYQQRGLQQSYLPQLGGAGYQPSSRKDVAFFEGPSPFQPIGPRKLLAAPEGPGGFYPPVGPRKLLAAPEGPGGFYPPVGPRKFMAAPEGPGGIYPPIGPRKYAINTEGPGGPIRPPQVYPPQPQPQIPQQLIFQLVNLLQRFMAQFGQRQF
jgi:hypothetical protein